MEQEEEATSPPFWLQNSSSGRRHLRRSYSLFVSSGTLLIFLVVIALAFTLVLVPTLHSFTSNIFKPQSVKKSWDSLNLILVLFAILCGFLSRNNNTATNNETPRSYENQSFSDTKPQTQSWYEEYPDNRTPYYRLRSFNSYPDLRQESSWGNERWRFSDDTRVNGYRGLDLHAAIKDEEEEEEETEQSRTEQSKTEQKKTEQSTTEQRKTEQRKTEQSIKNIEVDKFEARSNVGRSKEKTIEKPKLNHALGYSETEKLQGREKKKKNNRASATKDLLASLKGKKKKQRSRSVENFQSILNSEPPPTTLPSHPPTPPPLPSSSVLDNLFYSKKRKHKKLSSASPPTPPPLPPRHFSSKIVSKIKPLHQGVAKTKEEENFYALEENVLTGNESPLNPIPPPPPPPPPSFKMPVWKFKVQGDFVRIDSIKTGLPDSDEGVESSTGEDSETPLFYASPEIDSKADNFIERFRAGLRMEKMHSTKEKQGIGRSNLYPGLG